MFRPEKRPLRDDGKSETPHTTQPPRTEATGHDCMPNIHFAEMNDDNTHTALVASYSLAGTKMALGFAETVVEAGAELLTGYMHLLDTKEKTQAERIVQASQHKQARKQMRHDATQREEDRKIKREGFHVELTQANAQMLQASTISKIFDNAHLEVTRKIDLIQKQLEMFNMIIEKATLSKDLSLELIALLTPIMQHNAKLSDSLSRLETSAGSQRAPNVSMGSFPMALCASGAMSSSRDSGSEVIESAAIEHRR